MWNQRWRFVAFLLCFFLLITIRSTGIAQVDDLFLLNVGSPESAAMGEAGTVLPKLDPLNIQQNPAQAITLNSPLSLMYGASHAAYGTSYFNELDPRLRFDVFNVSFRLVRPLGLSREIHLGIGVLDNTEDSRLLINSQFGVDTFHITGSDRQYFFAVGWEAWYNIRLGFSVSDVRTRATPSGVGQYREISGVGALINYGLILDVPLDSYLGSITFSRHDFLQPRASIHLGTAHNFVGNPIPLYDAGSSTPPSTAHVNLGLECGFGQATASPDWKLINFRWADDASDILIQGPMISDTVGYDAVNDAYIVHSYTEDPSKTGFGKIQPFNNILLGKLTDHIALRKGWEISFGDFLFVRGGRIDDPDQDLHCNTSGYAFRLSGLARTISALAYPNADPPAILKFISFNIDLAYAYARYSGQGLILYTNIEIPDREISGWNFSIHM